MRDPWYVQYAVMSVKDRSSSGQPILYTIPWKNTTAKHNAGRQLHSITPNLPIVLRSYDAICWPLYPSLVWYKIVNGGIFFRKRGITSICIVCIIAKIRISVLFCFLTCPQRSPLIKLHLRIEISITSRNI